MKKINNKVLWLLLPFVLMMVIWWVNWVRLHPPATAEELKIEDLLGQADRMDVYGFISWGQGVWISVGQFGKSDFQDLTKGFRLSHHATDLASSTLPHVWFGFYKGSRELVTCELHDYKGNASLEFYESHPERVNLQKPLHWATVQRFRNFIRDQPQLQRNIDGNMYLH